MFLNGLHILGMKIWGHDMATYSQRLGTEALDLKGIYFQELYLGARWTGLMLCVNVKLVSKLQRFLFPVFKLLYLILFKWFLWILIFFYQLHFFIVTTIVVVIPSHGCLWHILLLFFSPEQYSNNSKDIH